MSFHESKSGPTVIDQIDKYLRRSDTRLARSLHHISPLKGTDYLHSNSKKTLDIAGGILGGAAALPVIILLAGVNKVLYPGDPAFFSHERVGHNGEIISTDKIRSLLTGSDYQYIPFEQYQNQSPWSGERTTRFGRFLRRHDLDELPQIKQVIEGKQSLIGPRIIHKESIKDLKLRWSKTRYDSWVKLYDTVPFGLSGVHQVLRKDNKIDTFRYHPDKFGVAHASLGFDLYLMWRTLRRMVRKKTRN